MKRLNLLKTVLRLVTGGVLLGALFLFCSWGVRGGEEETISFSYDSGFYDSPFYLEIYSSYDAIYYTLDSSEPDTASLRYTGPILIEDATKNPNVYSMRTDISPDFRTDLLQRFLQTDSIYGYEVPTQNIDKATVVRAIAVDGSGETTEIYTKVYWVGYSEKTGYAGMNIISVVTDPKNLFDYKNGIYVLGKHFDQDFLKQIDENTWIDPNIGWWAANYRMRHSAWEKPAEILLLDSERETLIEGQYGIRIQGGASRGFVKKSLNIFARKEYGNPTVPGDTLFKAIERLRSVNLYNGGSGSASSILHDYLINQLVQSTSIPTRHYEPYVLFLNGEYWGNYWLRERFEEDFFSNNFGTAADNVIEIKNGKIEVGADADARLYERMYQFVASEDMSIPANFEEACQIIDIDSYLDYYSIEIYLANWDWPNNNFNLWRTRNETDSGYSDGRWRWILYDMNEALEVERAQDDYIEYAAVRDDMFASLLMNDEFRDRLEKRLVNLAETVFDPGITDVLIDEYEQRMAEPMEKEFERFYGGNRTKEVFINECESIRSFFQLRQEYILNKYG